MAQATQDELRAILQGAAVAALTDRAFLCITGPDATRWLNGMVTNSIQALGSGEGCYNFLLNAQGRIQGDCTIYRKPGEGETSFLLETDSSQIVAIQEVLERFIIMDDVELCPQTYNDSVLLLGPKALDLASSSPGEAFQQLRSGGELQSPRLAESIRGEIVTATQVAGIPVLELASNVMTGASFFERMKSAGALEVSPAALEAFRVLSGTPRYGIDIRNSETARDLPQETGQTHALHFSKGCYLGQEIVERIRSRGQVHKLFTRFRLTGELPATLPAPLQAGDKPAGELTSAVSVPLAEGPQLLALGYARREFLESAQAGGQQLVYAGGTAAASPASKLV